MPAQITHCLAAEEALLLADPPLARVWGLVDAEAGTRKAGSPASWFRLGAQGPDIFYHNQRTMPSGLHYGALAHKRNYGLIVEGAVEAFLDTGASIESAEAAWILGFATHAALDRAIHPYIVYFSGWQVPLDPGSLRFRGCHPFLERLLDLFLLQEKRGQTVGSIDLEKLLPLDGGTRDEAAAGSQAKQVDAAIVDFMARGLRLAFPRAAGGDAFIETRVANALADARGFFRLTNPARTASGDRSFLAHFDERTGFRAIALIYPDSLPGGIDLGNEAGATWEHPAGDGRMSTARFMALYEAGVEAAAASLGLVLEAMRARKVPPGLSSELGNGGLSITDPDGIPVPPRLSRPLPLADLMEAEFGRRREQARRGASR